jgi:hypothetical protein
MTGAVTRIVRHWALAKPSATNKVNKAAANITGRRTTIKRDDRHGSSREGACEGMRLRRQGEVRRDAQTEEYG